MPGAHSHLPTIIGAAFAVSSLRALTLLTPFGGRLGGAPLPMLLGLIAVFAAGILLSMSLFGVAFAGLMTTRASPASAAPPAARWRSRQSRSASSGLSERRIREST